MLTSLPVAKPTRLVLGALLLCCSLSAIAAERHREMRRARYALENALKALQHANGKFGGHRERALELVTQALQEVREGLKDDKGWY
jgi:hypothetical protein